MNVQAGDLAIIKCGIARYDGRIVEVIAIAPDNQVVRFPNGALASTKYGPGPYWIVKFVGGAAWCPTDGQGDRLCPYGLCRDASLRPLPGDPIEERETDEVSA